MGEQLLGWPTAACAQVSGRSRKTVIREPARARLYQAPRELDFSRASGRGQNPPGDSLAITAAESGRRVYYGTLANLIESLEQARAAGQLASRLRVLSHPALLAVDEIGYLPVNRDGAVLFFQLINARYDHASTVLTPNKGIEEWGDILGDEVMQH
jgi:IstB-like ATP binding protein